MVFNGSIRRLGRRGGSSNLSTQTKEKVDCDSINVNRLSGGGVDGNTSPCHGEDCGFNSRALGKCKIK